MYSVYVDGTCIYDDTAIIDDYAIINPTLTLEDNSAGSFEFTLPPTNKGYGIVKRMVSEIIVKRGATELWSGRPVQDDYDIFKNQKIICEGELAYLNDTIQPPKEYHVDGSGSTAAVRSLLSSFITIHNSQLEVNSNKVFEVGYVTVTDPNDYIYRYTNYENTLEAIKEKLVDRLGGHIRIRKTNGVRYIDYLAEPVNTNAQVIRFGENLLDYAETFDMSDICTVCVPRGAALDDEHTPLDFPEALTAYLTVESVNQGSIYVKHQAAINRFGWIVKVVDWNDVEDALTLYNKAVAYLHSLWDEKESSIYERMQLNLTAFDLHMLDVNVQAINVFDKIRVVSEPHGLDRYFPVTKLQIPLQNPENTVFTLGETEGKSLSSVSTNRNESLKYDIQKAVSEVKIPTQEILDQALANAANLLTSSMNGYTTWVRTDHGDELFITDTEDYTAATRLWRWNLNGLAYGTKNASDPVDSTTWTTAITMDGTISGQFIAANSISGNKIYAGTIQDIPGNNYWNLNTGEFHISGISNAEVATEFQYCLSSSDTVAPAQDDPGWQNTFPVRSSGQYIWQRIKTTYADSTIAYTTAMCISNGQDGLVPYVVSNRGTDVSNLDDVTVTLTGIIGGGDGEDVDPMANKYIYIWFVQKDGGSTYSFLDVGKQINVRINENLCNEFAGIWFSTDPEDTYYKNESGTNYTNENNDIYTVYDL